MHTWLAEASAHPPCLRCMPPVLHGPHPRAAPTRAGRGGAAHAPAGHWQTPRSWLHMPTWLQSWAQLRLLCVGKMLRIEAGSDRDMTNSQLNAGWRARLVCTQGGLRAGVRSTYTGVCQYVRVHVRLLCAIVCKAHPRGAALKGTGLCVHHSLHQPPSVPRQRGRFSPATSAAGQKGSSSVTESRRGSNPYGPGATPDVSLPQLLPASPPVQARGATYQDYMLALFINPLFDATVQKAQKCGGCRKARWHANSLYRALLDPLHGTTEAAAPLHSCQHAMFVHASPVPIGGHLSRTFAAGLLFNGSLVLLERMAGLVHFI